MIRKIPHPVDQDFTVNKTFITTLSGTINFKRIQNVVVYSETGVNFSKEDKEARGYSS